MLSLSDRGLFCGPCIGEARIVGRARAPAPVRPRFLLQALGCVTCPRRRARRRASCAGPVQPSLALWHVLLRSCAHAPSLDPLLGGGEQSVVGRSVIRLLPSWPQSRVFPILLSSCKRPRLPPVGGRSLSLLGVLELRLFCLPVCLPSPRRPSRRYGSDSSLSCHSLLPASSLRLMQPFVRPSLVLWTCHRRQRAERDLLPKLSRN